MTKKPDGNAADKSSLEQTAHRQIADNLESVLAGQLEKLACYDIDGAMAMAQEADALAARAGRLQIFEKAAFAEQRKRIRDLYRRIGLSIASVRGEVAGKLKQIRKAVKTLSAYRNDA